jgi:hypothetical protein
MLLLAVCFYAGALSLLNGGMVRDMNRQRDSSEGMTHPDRGPASPMMPWWELAVSPACRRAQAGSLSSLLCRFECDDGERAIDLDCFKLDLVAGFHLIEHFRIGHAEHHGHRRHL